MVVFFFFLNLRHTFLIAPWAASFVIRFSTSDVLHCFSLQYLDCLWSQIQKLKKDRWQERHILRPYLAFDSILCEALQHNLPPFTPPPHTEDSVYPMPRVIFRMFDYTDDPEVCNPCKGEWADSAGSVMVQSRSKCDVLSPSTLSGLKIGSNYTLVLNKFSYISSNSIHRGSISFFRDFDLFSDFYCSV